MLFERSDLGRNEANENGRDEERKRGQHDDADDRDQIDPTPLDAEGVGAIDECDPQHHVADGAERRELRRQWAT